MDSESEAEGLEGGDRIAWWCCYSSRGWELVRGWRTRWVYMWMVYGYSRCTKGGVGKGVLRGLLFMENASPSLPSLLAAHHLPALPTLSNGGMLPVQAYPVIASDRMPKTTRILFHLPFFVTASAAGLWHFLLRHMKCSYMLPVKGEAYRLCTAAALLSCLI